MHLLVEPMFASESSSRSGNTRKFFVFVRIVGELIYCCHSPNIRMVDKFGEGRCFVAGGMFHLI